MPGMGQRKEVSSGRPLRLAGCCGSLHILHFVIGKKKKNARKPLRRPIICICNDQFAPALRPLRPVAKVIQFKPPTAKTVAKRLKQICDEEDLETDTRTLLALAEANEGDMRSSLMTLEVIYRQ